ncbi:5'-nucleotidase C-terminal domain-containing protein [Francisellaceae bacterium CB300]
MKKLFNIIVLCLFSFQIYAYDDMTILSLNDFHGQVEPNKDMVGAAKIASFITQYRKTHPNLMVVAAGDNYQGTALSNISHGAVVNDFFDYIGLKYSAVGNHDFDYGQQWFKSWYDNSDVRYLAANISYKNDSILFGFKNWFNGSNILNYIKPYDYHTFDNGKTVYFIGLSTLETPDTTAEKNISNLNFNNPITSANKWVSYISDYKKHNLPKPDAIVLLTHIPTEQENSVVGYSNKIKSLDNKSEIESVTAEVNGASGVFSGHSHQYVNGLLNSTAVVQGASQGKDISILHYDCHTVVDKCVVTPEVVNLAKATKDLPADKNVEKIINKYKDSIKDELNKIVSKASKPLSNQAQDGAYNIPLTYTLADIIRKNTSSDVALLNSHGVRSSLPKGNIAYSMIYEVMPFDNMVVTLDISGKNLLALIKHSLSFKEGEQLGVFAGVKISVDSNGKIKKVLINNKPLKLSHIYKVATIDFLITGGDGFLFKHMQNYKDSNIPIREFIVDYWNTHPVDIAKGWQNIKIAK